MIIILFVHPAECGGGGDCEVGDKCTECVSCSKEEFEKLVKHCKSLDAKSRIRKLLKMRVNLVSSYHMM